MCTVLPAELIHKILCISEPRDIIRWRTVSKWFRAITYDDLLWKTLYTDSSFPRPPGPSPSQSPLSLERILVKSEQLARLWTTRPMRELSRINIKLGQPSATTPTKLVSGRWLVGCEEARRFVLHDTDPRTKTHTRKVLWEQEEPTVSAWDVHSVSPVVGESVVYVLLELPKVEQRSSKWKLLEFRLNDESGEVYESITIHPPVWVSSSLSNAQLDGGRTRFLFIQTVNFQVDGIVFDTQTRLFYAVPLLRVALPETLPERFHDAFPTSRYTAFTDTHILVLYDYFQHLSPPSYATLIQIFAIPSNGSLAKEGIQTLCLTHEGFTAYRLLNVNITKLGVDSITGITTMRLLHHCFLCEDIMIIFVDLVLPKPRDHEVSPISIHVRSTDTIKILPQGVETSYYLPCAQYLNAGDGSEFRGFYREKPSRRSSDPIQNQYIIKFAIDMRQEPWVATCGAIAPPQWCDAADPNVNTGSSGSPRRIAFDGLRGRLWYVQPEDNGIVVVDIG